MRQYKWKKSLCMFLALLMLFSTFSTPQATFSADNVDVIENAVEEYVKSWFFENFSEHYILSDYSSSVSELTIATVYKGNIIKNLIMDCQSYTKYRPNETTGGIFVSWRRKEELPTGA